MAKQLPALYIYPEMYPIFELLSDADRGIVFKALYLYAVDGIEAELTGACAFAWPLLKMKVDEARQKYLQKCEQNRANIRKRYDRIPSNTTVYDRIPSNTKGYEQLPNLPTKTETETETKNISLVAAPPDGGQPKKRKSCSFVPPSVEEVSAYVRERGSRIDPQRFHDHYEANGWMAGRAKMKDWKAALRNWERNEPQYAGTKQQPVVRDYSYTGEDTL